MVYRIHHACSTWKLFHDGLVKAKKILENNQYPKSFYEPIIKKTLTKIIENEKKENVIDPSEEKEEEDPKDEKMIFVAYRGRVSERFEQSLRKLNTPCKVVFTLTKLKNCLPSLKPVVDKSFKSGVVYKIKCPRCNSCYVGQTSRHLICRIKEHKRNGPVAIHMQACNRDLTMDDVDILYSKSKNVYHLMTLEALMINELKPTLNTKDEYRSRSLVIKI